MDMKNEKIWNKMGRKFRSLLRNRKGMENWGLVFVVGGVALVTALTLAQQAGTSGGSFITKATDQADEVMGQYTGSGSGSGGSVDEANPCGSGEKTKKGGPYKTSTICDSFKKTGETCKLYESEYYRCK